MESSIIWLVKMIFSHLLSDFGFQKTLWVEERNQKHFKSKFLYLHILVTATTALLLVGFYYWKIILLIALAHYFIDIAKSYAKPTFINFLIDQLAHLGIILGCWALTFNVGPSMAEIARFYHTNHFWVFATGFFFLTYPSSIIIAQATSVWSATLNPPATNSPANSSTGLVNAGKYIGIIERVIICVLVYQNQYEAIGLLITGKSILRYNSSNEEIKTEYLLVGTLISISLAFAVGLALKYFGQGHFDQTILPIIIL